MNCTKLFLAYLLATAMAVTSGCGGVDDGSVPVAGTVTWNGEPLETGSITFMPADGGGRTTGADIENGKYEARVPPGEKKVAIYAERVTGQQARDPNDPSSEKYDVVEQYLPARYNKQTELTAMISEGMEPLDFALEAN